MVVLSVEGVDTHVAAEDSVIFFTINFIDHAASGVVSSEIE
jgi:hypothetical protein